MGCTNFVENWGASLDDMMIDASNEAYASAGERPAGCSYAIVRPGGLEESSTVVGPSGLEVSQGDALSGVVSRVDLADFTVELATSSALGFDTALELYTTASAQPCEGKFKPLLTDGRVARLHGATWAELLGGVQREGQYFVPA